MASRSSDCLTGLVRHAATRIALRLAAFSYFPAEVNMMILTLPKLGFWLIRRAASNPSISGI